MAQADLLRALAGSGKEHLGLRGVGVFFQKMVLHFPGIMVAKLICQFDLGQGVLIQLVFGVRFPGPRALQFIKNAEFHGFRSRSFSY